ncbi:MULTISPECIES: SDR family NAD(P)-dependent oxidoreductase [Glycomyces]|uniref:NAD(P)-dependent dehydrogenase (Short-subunit alcohol dehydrogenase family) n=2 Tax=Glycomyces TaxID=58113 RepID=A0A9X3PGT6_9ACTN|nr:SDR family NAD(P)-dependent oxidoreductase [Glycomyces lechevalierae]MDA1383418.1 SDR family NAD(P)-dependent oxidoreductase [Glycomyces lechevalierae]MDR7336424.1 NAD(P)-dependent dehydrogenase (short-subunit alcohol dehydrogenase family) [Glycomyces lechevalierae]
MNTPPLQGKRALVTGASRGIGRAVALRLAAAGADVAVLARGTDALDAVAREIKALGRLAVPVTCDVTDPDRLAAAFAESVEGLGGLDTVVNNAGGFYHSGPFLQLTQGDWERTRGLNLDPTVQLLRLAGTELAANGGGSVLNVTSIAGLGGAPRLSLYAVCKAAMVSLTKTLAVEWAAQGIRVNAIAPGWIDTKLTSGFTGHPQVKEALQHEVPQNRWAEPEDVADAAVFLSGDGARLVTGAVLVLDGGLTSQLSAVARGLLGLGRAAA